MRSMVEGRARPYDDLYDLSADCIMYGAAGGSL